MSIGEIAMIAGILLGTPTFIASVYYGFRRVRRDIEDGAYAKAKSEMVLQEATKTIAQKDQELAIKSTALAESTSRERRLERVADEQRSIIDRLSRALEQLGGTNEAVTS